MDALDYYLYDTGDSAHRFIDPQSGEYKSALDELLLTSTTNDCASLALIAYSLIASDSFDVSDLSGISAAWLDGQTVRYVGNDITLTSPHSDEKIAFTIEKVN